MPKTQDEYMTNFFMPIVEETVPYDIAIERELEDLDALSRTMQLNREDQKEYDEWSSHYRKYGNPVEFVKSTSADSYAEQVSLLKKSLKDAKDDEAELFNQSKDMLDEAKEQEKKREAHYVIATRASYGLYILGALIALTSKIFGKGPAVQSE